VTCSSSASSTCTSCNSNYYLSGGTCNACPTSIPYCTTVTCTATAGTCSQCSSGYYINSGGTCSICNSLPSPCVTWACTSSSASTCTSCSYPWYWLNSGATCSPTCPSYATTHCQSCPSVTCIKCMGGWKFQSGNSGTCVALTVG